MTTALHAVPTQRPVVRLYDAGGVAEVLAISKRQAQRLMADGGPLHTVPKPGEGRGRRVRADDLAAYVDSLDGR